jgi:hypothetical protein
MISRRVISAMGGDGSIPGVIIRAISFMQPPMMLGLIRMIQLGVNQA